MKGVQTSAQKREFINGKINIGIDSAKDKHQVRIIDLIKLPLESPDSIGVSPILSCPLTLRQLLTLIT